MDYLVNGVHKTVSSLPQDGAREDCAAVVVSGGTLPWVLRFWAKLGTYRVYIGAVRIFPDPGDRAVAWISCPGAVCFETEGKASAVTDDTIGIHFEGTQARGGPWGVQPVAGNSVEGSRSYRVATGAAGVVTITGAVLGWAAWTTQAGGTVTVAAPPALGFGPIAIPQNGEVSGNAQGLLAPISTWTFANTDGYSIEYVPPGVAYDG